MQRYDTYKPSGVKWLGEIPSHWEMISTKYIAKLYTGNSLNDASKEKYSLFSDDSYPYIASKDISLGTGTVDYDNGLYIPKDESFFEIAPKNSFLLCIEGGSAGRKKAFLDRNCFFVNKLCCFDSALNPKYHYYFIQGDYFRTMFNCSLQGMIGGVSVSALKNIYTIVPSLEEQTAIANYLDTATAKIDAAIAQQQKMIDLLNERKQIIINRAVTRGLNPNARMKDSGVEWIGEVPEHWQLLPYRYLFYNLDKLRMPITADQRSRNNPQYDYYGASGVIDKIDYYNVDDKVLLIGEDGANLLMRNLPIIYKAEGKFWVNNHAHILKPIRDDYDYLAYVMEAADYTLFITGSAQPKLSQANLNCVKLPIPPLEEQKAIVDYLSKRTSKIDEAIKESNNMISLLQERKQIIINDVVTGKIRIL